MLFAHTNSRGIPSPLLNPGASSPALAYYAPGGGYYVAPSGHYYATPL